MLPSRYTQAVMTGESAAGLLVSINRIVTKALLEDEKVNTILFFGISIGIVMVCFMIHFVLRKTEFVNFYISSCTASNEVDELQKRIILEPTEDVGLVDMLDVTETKGGKYGVLSLRSPPSSPKADSVFEPEKITQSQQDLSDDNDPWKTSCESINVESSSGTKYRVQDVVIRMRRTTYTKHIQWWSGIKRGVINRWQVTQQVWPYMLTICLAYFVTLCLFPGIESEIVSCRWSSWMPVILMAIFNLFDFIGKILSSVSHKWTKKQLLLLSSLRVLLVPLLAMCAAPRGKPLINGETWPMIFSLFLGLSNGVFGSVPMILAPTMVPDEQKELTGNIMTLSYSIGLTSGSGVAYFINYLLGPPLLDPCLPYLSGVSTPLYPPVLPEFENITSYSINSTSMGAELFVNMTILSEFALNSSLV